MQEYVTGRMKHTENLLKQLNIEIYSDWFWQELCRKTSSVLAGENQLSNSKEGGKSLRNFIFSASASH